MNGTVICCPICGGATTIIEQKKTFLRPQQFFHQCESEGCSTKVKIEESFLKIDDTKNKESEIWKEFKNTKLTTEAINTLAKRAKLGSEESSNGCNSCKHRKVGHLCMKAGGPFQNLKINIKSHFCDSFEESEALKIFFKGIFELGSGNEGEAAKMLAESLVKGIPEDDQVLARTFLGDIFLRNDRLREGIELFDTALELDAKHEVGYFTNKQNRDVYFGNYDILSPLMADSIKEKEGIKEALRFLERHMENVDYLSGNVLFKKYFFPLTWHHIGGYYLENKDVKSAMKAFEKCVKSEHYEDSDVQKRAKENAKEILEQYEIDKINEKRARRG